MIEPAYMPLLTVNIGTSSIKCSVVDVHDQSVEVLSKTRAYPLHKAEPTVLSTIYPVEETHKEISNDTKTILRDAVSLTLEKANRQETDLMGIGIRVVHSGGRFFGPVMVDDSVFSVLQDTRFLAPLHNPPALDGIALLRELYPSVRIVAVFDTIFHNTMPDVAKVYALPDELVSRFGVRRYGFHGLAHASMLHTYCTHVQQPAENVSLITLQLGSGCSACAIKNGTSIDTTMGFSPLEGLISRTRTGDIDASLVTYLAHRMNKPAEEITEFLNSQSGLLGMAGLEGDMKDILDYSCRGDALATKAVDLYVYRIQKYIGAYDAIVGKAQAIILGGGVSEHCPEIWKRIFSLPVFGISLAPLDHIVLTPPLTRLTTDDSSRHAWVAFVDEEKEIARLTYQHLTSH